MPCMGPSKKYADQQSELAYQEIKKLLCEKYRLVDMEKPDLQCWVSDEQRINYMVLQAILNEIFWTDAIDSW
jgi:undecaprenyl pyrophosphate synthase